MWLVSKITSFFKPDVDNVLDSPDEAVPVVQPDDFAVFEEAKSALNRENLENNLEKIIKYMFGRCEQSSHFNSLLLSKAFQLITSEQGGIKPVWGQLETQLTTILWQCVRNVRQ